MDCTNAFSGYFQQQTGFPTGTNWPLEVEEGLSDLYSPLGWVKDNMKWPKLQWKVFLNNSLVTFQHPASAVVIATDVKIRKWLRQSALLYVSFCYCCNIRKQTYWSNIKGDVSPNSAPFWIVVCYYGRCCWRKWEYWPSCECQFPIKL